MSSKLIRKSLQNSIALDDRSSSLAAQSETRRRKTAKSLKDDKNDLPVQSTIVQNMLSFDDFFKKNPTRNRNEVTASRRVLKKKNDVKHKLSKNSSINASGNVFNSRSNNSIYQRNSKVRTFDKKREEKEKKKREFDQLARLLKKHDKKNKKKKTKKGL